MTDETKEVCNTSGAEDAGAATAPQATRPMRRRAMLIVLLACVMLIGAGFTAAYVVDQQQADNVLTFGSVSMKVVQTEKDADGEHTIPSENYSVQAASGVASRIVKFENVGSTPMYVRARPVMTGLNSENEPQDPTAVAGVTDFQMGDVAWVQKNPDDSWWYYTEVVDVDETTDPLMTGIEFSGDFYSVVGDGGRYDFTVEAQAVQAENQAQGATATTAVGWPGTEEGE